MHRKLIITTRFNIL